MSILSSNKALQPCSTHSEPLDLMPFLSFVKMISNDLRFGTGQGKLQMTPCFLKQENGSKAARWNCAPCEEHIVPITLPFLKGGAALEAAAPVPCAAPFSKGSVLVSTGVPFSKGDAVQAPASVPFSKGSVLVSTGVPFSKGDAMQAAASVSFSKASVLLSTGVPFSKGAGGASSCSASFFFISSSILEKGRSSSSGISANSVFSSVATAAPFA